MIIKNVMAFCRGYVDDYEDVVGVLKVDYYYDDDGIVVIRNCSKIHSR